MSNRGTPPLHDVITTRVAQRAMALTRTAAVRYRPDGSIILAGRPFIDLFKLGDRYNSPSQLSGVNLGDLLDRVGPRRLFMEEAVNQPFLEERPYALRVEGKERSFAFYAYHVDDELTGKPAIQAIIRPLSAAEAIGRAHLGAGAPAGMAVLVFDASRTCVSAHVSPQWRAAHGLPAGDLEGLGLDEALTPVCGPGELEEIAAAVSAGDPYAAVLSGGSEENAALAVDVAPANGPAGSGFVATLRELPPIGAQAHVMARLLEASRCYVWSGVMCSSGGRPVWQSVTCDDEAGQAFIPLAASGLGPYVSTLRANVAEHFPEDSRRLTQAARLAASERQDRVSLAYRCRDAWGAQRWCLEEWLLEALSGDRWRVHGLILDGTAQRQEEEHVRQQLRELGILNGIITAANDAADLRTLMQVTVVWTIGMLDFDAGAVQLYPGGHSGGPSLLSRGMTPELEGFLTKTLRRSAQDGGRYGREDAVFLDHDALTNEGVQAQSLASVPLICQDGVVGALHAVSFDASRVEETRQQVLLSIGRAVGGAIARRMAEDELKRRLDFEQLVSFISNRFAGAPALQMDQAFEHALGVLGRFVAADSAFVAVLDAPLKEITAVHEWSAGGMKPLADALRRLQPRDQPALIEALRAGRPLEHVRGERSDSRAALEPFLEALGVASILCLPLVAEERVLGLFALVLHKRTEPWAPKDADLIRVAGDVFTSALHRMEVTEERRKLDNRMLGVQKEESLGILAGGVAHDFNNLLMSILGHVDIARSLLEAEHPASGCLDQVAQASQRAAGLTSQLLAYAGKGKLQVAELDLTAAVKEMLQLLSSAISHKAALNAELAAEPLMVQADPVQIQQVIMNLITNASDALEGQSGGLTIRTFPVTGEEEDADAYMLVSNLSGAFAALEVSDTGCGMDEDTLQAIFDPFFSTKFAGRGLGLAGVLGIVRSHRGAIRVASQPGQGTTFRVLFPVSRRKSRKPAEQEAPALPAGDSSLVLVADDDPSIREISRRALEHHGFRALVAEDGAQAVQFFTEHAGRIAAVVLDVKMPKVDGFEAHQEIRRLSGTVPVILTSGYAEGPSLESMGPDRAAIFLQKPYRPTELVRMIHKLLQGRTAGNA